MKDRSGPGRAGRFEEEARSALLTRRRALERLWPDASPSAHQQSELAELDAALQRIERGLYGVCEECGGPIGRQRLKAVPEARRCLGCSVPSRGP